MGNDLQFIAVIILAGCLGFCCVIWTISHAIKSLLAKPGRRELNELKARISALEEHCREDAERLETMRTLVLAQESGIRKEMRAALEDEESPVAGAFTMRTGLRTSR